MLLAIDIGNTNIVLGVWDGTQWLSRWRLRTVRERTPDELGIYLRGLMRDIGDPGLERIVLCSVVPSLTAVTQEACTHYLGCEPIVVNTKLNLGINNRTDVPSQVGADRLANAVAAHHIYPVGTAAIIIDMGTATKLDVVTSEGFFLGGIISPGLQITSEALFQRAAKLSQVELTAPPEIIGRNTVHAIQSGLIFGYVSMIEGLLPKLSQELQTLDANLDSIKTIGTGGLIHIITPYTKMIDEVDPWLTLKGLQIIADRQ